MGQTMNLFKENKAGRVIMNLSNHQTSKKRQMKIGSTKTILLWAKLLYYIHRQFQLLTTRAYIQTGASRLDRLVRPEELTPRQMYL